MKPPSETQFLQPALEVLADLQLGTVTSAKAKRLSAARGADAEVTLSTGDKLLLEYKSSDRIAALTGAVDQRDAMGLPASKQATYVLVVPFMGPSAREFAAERQLDWLDLSGNADLWTGSTRFLSRGHKNRFAALGRPSTAFAPKAARIARALLTDHPRSWTQRELAQATALSEGHVSRTLQRLVDADLVVKVQGSIQVPDPVLLLRAWEQDYEGPHDVMRAHVGARTSEAVLDLAALALHEAGIEHAATGLAGAWHHRPFAQHRLVSILVERLPTPRESGSIGLDVTGGNLELLVPRDSGVFYGAQDGFASPVQVYMDLASSPERSEEAKSEMLELLKERWSR